MKVGLIGGVNSTRVTLEALIKHQFNIALVMGYEPNNTDDVSGYCNLSELCIKYDLPYKGFERVNDHLNDFLNAELDVLFVVGLSQLVSRDIIESSKIGTVGFHPTNLPKGRGRAPLAWMVFNQEEGAANFFVLREIADAGPIFVKESFPVTSDDDAYSVEQKMLCAMNLALDKWLPVLKKGIWNPIDQDESRVTEYGVRKPDDGLIDFNQDAFQIDRLIKASAPPHPGAFTFYSHEKLTIIKSNIESRLKIQGCIGRVLKVEVDRFLVQAGNGLIWLYPKDTTKFPKIGQKLGYVPQIEINHIYEQLSKIKNYIGLN